jgi:nucleotide-binding universal stress UspA family protein
MYILMDTLYQEKIGNTTRVKDMKKKLVWLTFDPFQKDQKLQVQALEVVFQYAKRLNAQIEPVYFADRYRGKSSGSYLFPLFPEFESVSQDELAEFAIGKWSELAKKVRIKTLPLRILTHKSGEAPSLELKAKSISSQAKRAGALFVALPTKATSGIKRFILGSFAETFLLNSTMPTLMIPSTTVLVAKPQVVLFPSDLGPSSFLAFKRMCPIFKALKVKVILCHCIEVPESLLEMLSPNERKKLNIKKIIDQEALNLEDKVSDFNDLAKTFRIKLEFKVCTDYGYSNKSEAILDFSQDVGTDCIALVSQSGELKTSVVGATSRSIVRGSKYPVLIHRIS